VKGEVDKPKSARELTGNWRGKCYRMPPKPIYDADESQLKRTLRMLW